MANIKLQAYEDNKTKIIYAINQLSNTLDKVQAGTGGALTDAPSDGNYYLRRNGVWVAVNPQLNSGQLTLVSASQLVFAPYNGDRIKINGTIYQIPAAGIAGLGATGVFVNGVAGQSLVGGTVYYVYCFNNGGTLTGDYSTTGYVNSTTAGNVGTMVKSGDNTRTLIGLIYYTSSGFVDSAGQRFVRSWFNRQPAVMDTYQNWGPGGGSGAWFATGNYVQYVCFANDVARLVLFGFVYNTVTGGATYVGIALDNPASPATYSVYVTTTGGGYWVPQSCSADFVASEGVHTAYIVYQAGSGSGAAGQTWISGAMQSLTV